jgi:hypothetical protein
MTRQQSMTAIAIAGISVIAVLVYGYITYQKNKEINEQTNQLIQLSTYEINPDETLLRPYGSNFSTVNDLLDIEAAISTTLERYHTLAKEQSTYYNMLLRYLYFPRLNIWKNPYTQAIDPTIMGQKYLELDPFQDIPLIQYRSDFFKNVGEGAEYNEISSINVGEISDVDSEHFIIPVELSFTSPDKRSFLLLINKLSTTSNANNIALLNEFFYYLIKNIKEGKQEQIQALKEIYTPLFSGISEEGPDEDTIIGYYLYQRAKEGTEVILTGIGNTQTFLIDDELINETIKENVLCDATTAEQESNCFYKFREKYRDLPYLAYTIGIKDASGKSQSFKNFLQDLPPVITISNFSFEKVQNSDIFSSTSQAQFYQGNIKFNAYGQSMTDGEVGEIANILGELCFGKQEPEIATSTPISPEVAINRVNESILQLGSNMQLSNIINDLEELSFLFTNIQDEYSGLTNYKKTIRLFEIYRMLKDANLCSL